MQESLVKVVFFFTALFSIALGGVLLIIPNWVVQYTGIGAVDVGWLRSVGASILTVQGFGLLFATFRRKDTNPLVGLIAAVTTVEAGTLWYSLFTGEFGEMSRWAVVGSAILGTVAAVFLWLSSVSRRRTLKGKPARRERGDKKQNADQIPDPQSAPADLLEQIDQESPRLKDEV